MGFALTKAKYDKNEAICLYALDTDSDSFSLPEDAPVGSRAVSAETGNTFVMTSNLGWVELGGGEAVIFDGTHDDYEEEYLEITNVNLSRVRIEIDGDAAPSAGTGDRMQPDVSFADGVLTIKPGCYVRVGDDELSHTHAFCAADLVKAALSGTCTNTQEGDEEYDSYSVSAETGAAITSILVSGQPLNDGAAYHHFHVKVIGG